MRSVLGAAVVIAIMCSANLAVAQDGWGTPPPSGGSGEGSEGWGESSGQPASGQPESGGGSGWGNTDTSPQAGDPETPTGGQTSGWGNNSQPSTTQPQPTTQPATPQATNTAEETGPVGAAFRLQHRAALGAHNHMSGAFLAAWDGIPSGQLHSNTPWINLSFMYTFNERLALDIFFGFTVGVLSYAEDDDDTIGNHAAGDQATSFELGFGPRLLITLAEGDHARLYTGFGLGVLIGLLNGVRGEDDSECPDMGCGGWDAYGFSMAAPVGFEYRFRRVPNLAFSAEVNFHFVFQSVGVRYEDPTDAPESVSEAEYNHIVVGLGNPRQEGAFNVVDFLSFLTIGFHWLI